MKRLVTLLLTVALCVPMFMTTSVEVRAEDSEPTEPTETYDCAHSYAGCDRKVDTEGAVCEECVRREIPVYNQFELEGVKKHDTIYKCSKNGCDYVFDTSSTECTYTEGTCVCGRTEEVENNTNVAELIGLKHVGFKFINELHGERNVDGFGIRVEEIGENNTVTFPVKLGFVLDWYGVPNEKPEVLNYEMHIDDKGELVSAEFVDDGLRVVFPEDASAGDSYWISAYISSVTLTGDVVKTVRVGSTFGITLENLNNIPTEGPKYETSAPTEEQISEAIAKAVEEKNKAEESIPVEDFISTEAVNAIPTEVKGNATTDAVFNVSKITTTRGFVAAVDKIVKENPQEKNVTFYSDNAFAFNDISLNALVNANKDFVYMFKHNGKLYKVTIPAGAKIDLAGQRFAGPLYIGAQLGTAVVVE